MTVADKFREMTDTANAEKKVRKNYDEKFLPTMELAAKNGKGLFTLTEHEYKNFGWFLLQDGFQLHVDESYPEMPVYEVSW